MRTWSRSRRFRSERGRLSRRDNYFDATTTGISTIGDLYMSPTEHVYLVCFPNCARPRGTAAAAGFAGEIGGARLSRGDRLCGYRRRTQVRVAQQPRYVSLNIVGPAHTAKNKHHAAGKFVSARKMFHEELESGKRKLELREQSFKSTPWRS